MLTAPCLHALISEQGELMEQGCAPVSDLGALIAQAERVVLLLAAADVTLLRMQVPPLSAARLKAALPHLVEDHILIAPDDCVIVAASKNNTTQDKLSNLRQIAVVQRVWLESLVKDFTALGARAIQALPAQLCLPWREDGVVAVVAEHGMKHSMQLDLALRLSEYQGFGWSTRTMQEQSAPSAIVEELRVVVPQLPITLYVSASSYGLYSALDVSDVTVLPDDWSHWARAVRDMHRNRSLDLVAGLNLGTSTVNWKNWRWTLALAAGFLLMNTLALNVAWWNLRSEADFLRSGMIHRYRSAYPHESVIVDPIAQTRQKIAFAEKQAGRLNADDFLALVTQFGSAWARLPEMQSSKKDAIAGLEYRDRHLLVRFKQSADVEAYRAPLKEILQSAQLTLTQSEASIWQIESVK